MQNPELSFFIEYYYWNNPKKVIREEFKGRDEVFSRLSELTGTFDPDRDIYIRKWQAGMPMTDYEHFYEV